MVKTAGPATALRPLDPPEADSGQALRHAQGKQAQGKRSLDLAEEDDSNL